MFKIFQLRYERLDIQFECTIAAKNLANAAKNLARAPYFFVELCYSRITDRRFMRTF